MSNLKDRNGAEPGSLGVAMVWESRALVQRFAIITFRACRFVYINSVTSNCDDDNDNDYETKTARTMKTKKEGVGLSSSAVTKTVTIVTITYGNINNYNGLTTKSYYRIIGTTASAAITTITTTIACPFSRSREPCWASTNSTDITTTTTSTSTSTSTITTTTTTTTITTNIQRVRTQGLGRVNLALKFKLEAYKLQIEMANCLEQGRYDNEIERETTTTTTTTITTTITTTTITTTTITTTRRSNSLGNVLATRIIIPHDVSTLQTL
ncbi:hypothetical protein M0802_005138 [Mischocyttarus mexicanus]|nr:hypothetical protein M0802_005138 [Mischocyttarus mexicanus]